MRNSTATRPSAGDFWGGLAAMLVALPASMAFGLAVYAALGPQYAARGAFAGIVGAAVLGLVASWLGGTERLISAPCAPAAAVLSAFAIGLVHRGVPVDVVAWLLVLVGLLGGIIQLTLGMIGVGGLIRYIPYPVVSGYLTAVGLIIIGGQIPTFLGVPSRMPWYDAIRVPGAWDVRAILIALVTATVASLASRAVRRVPGIILGIAAGMLVFVAFACIDPALRVLAQNPLVIGAFGVDAGGLLDTVTHGWTSLGGIAGASMVSVLGTAATLGVLLSIDTLKTCVVLDHISRTRHNPNRELFGQGVANVVANALGGISGAGQMARRSWGCRAARAPGPPVS